ncbi:MAG: hypothetical protein MUC36_15255 [Planctomycetes bacterium]|jgi:hypothetical protein|nr:hypothetical protein [Planctomycetota bacterium]
MSKTHFVPYAVSLFALAACGGGDNDTTGGAIVGLQGPEQVSIIESNGGSNGSVRLPRGTYAIAGSDFETDPTRFWVRDDSMVVLDTVNMILSSLQQTRYWEQTNTGAYRALVEEENESGGDSSQGPVYKEWVVNSTRASSTAPQIVNFWVVNEESMGMEIPSTIYGKLTVSAEPSNSQPLGSFELYFKNLPDTEAPTSTATLFEGYLRTVARTDGQSEVEFYLGHGDPDGTVGPNDFATRERVHVIGDRTAGTGRAYAERKSVRNENGQTYSENGEYQLQFNADYVARRDVANGNALEVLDRNDYETRVFRYGLYDGTTEERVDRLSGFPVQDADGKNGFAGFHGIWFPENVTLVDGQTVYRRSFSSNTLTPYTLKIAAGKLEKRVRSSLTLGDLQNEDLEYFSPGAGGQMKVRFTGSDLVKVAERNGGDWQPVDPPVSITSSFSTGQYLNFWSQARGSVEFAWPASLTSSVPAYVWSRTNVTADSSELASGDLTLHGYSRLLRANITSNQANFQNSETPYFPNASSASSGNQTYVFDRETLLLTLGGDPVKFANGVTVTQGPAQFGLSCGPLFATALTDLADIQNQSTTYEWQIGTNPWNQLRTLRDANGAYVDFDPPIRFSYVHDEDGSSFDGRTFFLQWDGTNLGGIPFEQSQEDNRYYPLLNIPTGSTVVADGTTYKIKQLEGEQLMIPVNNPNTIYTAQGFDLDGQTISAPTAAPYQDPAVGAKPTVTAAPRYVGGVSQSDD